MTREMTQLLQRSLQNSLQSDADAEALEILDLVPLPRSTDRMVRFRGIQEVLEEFGEGDEGVFTYVIQVRRRDSKPAQGMATEDMQREGSLAKVDEIYRPDGTLNADFLLENARLLFGSGEYVAARQIYTTLRKAGTHTSEAMLGLARCFEAEGSVENSLRSYEESILYHPQLETYQRFAALLIRMKRDQQAAEVLERALLMKGSSDRARFEMMKAAGNCWMRSQAYPKAEKLYRQALALRPDSDLIATNLGALQLQMDQPEQAVASFKEALKLNPSNTRALTGTATAELALGRKSSAYDSYLRSLRVDLQQPKAIFQVVRLAYELRQHSDAAEILRQYIDVSPYNANLLFSLAGLEFHLSRIDRSLKLVNQILEINPNHAEALKLRERIHSL